jgi:hypothetical protein
MKFKPTQSKVIFSILIPLFLLIAVVILSFYRISNTLPSFLRSFFDLYDSRKVLDLGNILLFAIEVVVIYLVSSLFQKREPGMDPIVPKNVPVVTPAQPPAPVVQPPANPSPVSQPAPSNFNFSLPDTNPNTFN